jgi:hypothetical protein
MEQIQTFQQSDFTSEIWELAQGYKQMASDTRLGLPRTLNANLQKTPAGMAHTVKKAGPGISKGATRLQEMKDKREQGKKVKMVIGMAVSEETGNGKPKQPQNVSGLVICLCGH